MKNNELLNTYFFESKSSKQMICNKLVEDITALFLKYNPEAYIKSKVSITENNRVVVVIISNINVLNFKIKNIIKKVCKNKINIKNIEIIKDIVNYKKNENWDSYGSIQFTLDPKIDYFSIKEKIETILDFLEEETKRPAKLCFIPQEERDRFYIELDKNFLKKYISIARINEKIKKIWGKEADFIYKEYIDPDIVQSMPAYSLVKFYNNIQGFGGNGKNVKEKLFTNFMNSLANDMRKADKEAYFSVKGTTIPGTDLILLVSAVSKEDGFANLKSEFFNILEDEI
jgi:hypothetical protein